MHDLNAYLQQDAIGSGGFADVYRAVHIVTGRTVALKRSRSAPDCVARAKREIEVQRLLLHGNVMPVLDWADDGSWFIMPLARGDLGAVRDLEVVEKAALLRLVEDVAAALASAHRRGLVHRDLTPANILWLEDRWVVADWGFVKLPPGQARTQLTRARTGVGTECFTAPEVYADSSTATPAADIYSLGRVVGWMLALEPIQPNKSIVIPTESPWTKFVTETTRDDPAERPPTVAAALELLGPVLKEYGTEPPTLPQATSSVPAVETNTTDALKAMLQDDSRRIYLEELVDRETETAYAKLGPASFPVSTHSQGAELQERLRRYVEACSVIRSVVMYGCAYGSDAHARLWTKAVRRLGHPEGEWAGSSAMLALRFFPVTLLMYAGGIAALEREQWVNLGAVTSAPKLSKAGDEDAAPAATRAAALKVLDQRVAQSMPGYERRHTAMSDWLFEQTREPLRSLIRIDADYEVQFNRFECLVAMLYVPHSGTGWVPFGRFAWRGGRHTSTNTTTAAMRAEVNAQGANWGAIRAGMFEDVRQALAAVDAVEETIKRTNFF
jgi:serine/threonine protein kinase